MTQEEPQGGPEKGRPAGKAAPQVHIPAVIPILGSGATVIYPSQLMPVLATEAKDIRTIDEAAVTPAKAIGIFAQKPIDGQYQGDLYSLGTAATILRMAKAPDGSIQAILQGVARIRLLEVEQQEPYLRGRVERLQETVERNLELEAMPSSSASSTFRSACPKSWPWPSAPSPTPAPWPTSSPPTSTSRPRTDKPSSKPPTSTSASAWPSISLTTSWRSWKWSPRSRPR